MVDTLYGGMENAVNKLTREMFRDHIARLLGPSPFCPKWPISRAQAEGMADKVIERMDAQPDGGLSIMNGLYRSEYED